MNTFSAAHHIVDIAI